MSKLTLIALCRSAALAAALGSCLVACRKDEPPPPLPVAPKAPEPVAEAPLELKAEDAGLPAAPTPPPKATGTRKPSGLSACCAALRQNSVSAPEPTKGYMKGAADLCDLAATQGKDKSSILGGLSIALKGAGLPADCK